jgi:hypothetical protein
VIEIGAEPARTADVPAFACAASDGGGERVELGRSALLDRRLRGLAVDDSIAAPVTPAPGHEVLAAAASGAAWTRSRDGVPEHRVGAPLPELEPGEDLYALLLRRPLALVALLHFLRELTAQEGWQPPPPRAAIVFDDPNLRWRSYGFIDYRRLVEHADAHGYHAAMAMIPLDAGRAHGPTVALFARRPDRLSLVFHGNDHVKRELLVPRDGAAAMALTAQAQRRVARFEQRSGLAVDRIMMPPHGLCSRAVARSLPALGFDGLCAIHPLPWTVDRPTDRPLVGWWPAEFVDGCAVIPRMHLSSSRAEIALRAFADQPVVLYGHHDDVAGGLEPLAAAAAAVNRLGDVRWLSVGAIARSNVAVRMTGGRAQVRPFAGRVEVELPAGVRSVAVDAPVDAGDGAVLHGWSLDRGPAIAFGASAPIAGARTVEIRLHGGTAVDALSVARPAWRPWPRLRRAATEARDRMLPLRPARPRTP